MTLKDLIRNTLIYLHIDLNKNLKYDRLTGLIFKKVLKPDSNCIDVGCHKGEILEMMLKLSHKGKHMGFEPIPYLNKELIRRYGQKATIHTCALADQKGEATFQLVKNAPAYSGLKQRRYDVANPEIEEIKVKVDVLDELVPANQKIDLLKIDVEGGEFGVLKGAVNMLKRDKPVVVFECGLGGSDYYGTKPEDIFGFFNDQIGLGIYTLQAFIKEQKPLSAAEFKACFDSNSEYYFVAARV